MTACRRAGAVTVVFAMAGTLSAIPAGPAGAHGATGNPPSRGLVCGPEGGSGARSGACRAAAAASGVQAVKDWDNIRVPGVNGRDRQVIPDGRLCSGGIARFRGLDLARTDWPATRMVSGARFTFKYRVTIPHRGAFRLYVTRNGYDRSHALRWSDLESRPFLTVTDPPVRGGAYVAAGRLPKGKTGRHLIYTVWQTSNTPDTYYSCSDVVFAGTGAGSGAGSGAGARGTRGTRGAARPAATRTARPAGTATPASAAPVAGVSLNPAASRERDEGGGNGVLPLAAGGAGLFLLVVAASVALVRRRGAGRHS
ncbi:lytic polysaccharide monooxygenase auxiliary activity family 9 protein [Actinomadura scrupuli]|uniref:lytic polysaccharide monooxygenase auxiliary activity family 9 protein n=1 Tax=Actinomadura scrupuli TaxID=559629 RepID=UPI003D9684FE